MIAASRTATAKPDIRPYFLYFSTCAIVDEEQASQTQIGTQRRSPDNNNRLSQTDLLRVVTLFYPDYNRRPRHFTGSADPLPFTG